MPTCCGSFEILSSLEQSREVCFHWSPTLKQNINGNQLTYVIQNLNHPTADQDETPHSHLCLQGVSLEENIFRVYAKNEVSYHLLQILRFIILLLPGWSVKGLHHH